MKAEITLGMMAPKPSRQLRGQGIDKEALRIIDGIEEARQWLYLNHFISTAENDKIVKKIFRMIQKEVDKVSVKKNEAY